MQPANVKEYHIHEQNYAGHMKVFGSEVVITAINHQSVNDWVAFLQIA